MIRIFKQKQNSPVGWGIKSKEPVTVDSDFHFRQLISQVCTPCFYHIRHLLRISTAKTISTALISRCFVYCNSLLNSIAKRNLAKLQRVQHCLARVVLSAPRLSPSLPLLKQLEWLPVTYRTSFKHIVLYLHNSHPTWLVSCIFQISIGSSDNQFHNNLLCLKQNIGKRDFSVAAPRAWNELPINLKTF